MVVARVYISDIGSYAGKQLTLAAASSSKAANEETGAPAVTVEVVGGVKRGLVVPGMVAATAYVSDTIHMLSITWCITPVLL
jgi:hypothetical protein